MPQLLWCGPNVRVKDAGVEPFEEPRNGGADPSEPDDANRLAVESRRQTGLRGRIAQGESFPAFCHGDHETDRGLCDVLGKRGSQ